MSENEMDDTETLIPHFYRDEELLLKTKILCVLYFLVNFRSREYHSSTMFEGVIFSFKQRCWS